MRFLVVMVELLIFRPPLAPIETIQGTGIAPVTFVIVKGWSTSAAPNPFDPTDPEQALARSEKEATLGGGVGAGSVAATVAGAAAAPAAAKVLF
jgi:hypothetical protein